MEQQTQRQLFLLLSFKGTNYHGFQVQENAVTIASTVQDAVEKVFHKRLDIKGCSRTDAGVHANAFGLTLKTDQAIPCDALVRAMNVNLPADIAVFDCYEVPLDFHPRYSCKGKQYVYKIWNCSVRNPFLTDQLYHFKYPLDVNLMDQAAKAFLGEHDFSAFCSSGSSVQDLSLINI